VTGVQTCALPIYTRVYGLRFKIWGLGVVLQPWNLIHGFAVYDLHLGWMMRGFDQGSRESMRCTSDVVFELTETVIHVLSFVMPTSM